MKYKLTLSAFLVTAVLVSATFFTPIANGQQEDPQETQRVNELERTIADLQRELARLKQPQQVEEPYPPQSGPLLRPSDDQFNQGALPSPVLEADQVPSLDFAPGYQPELPADAVPTLDNPFQNAPPFESGAPGVVIQSEGSETRSDAITTIPSDDPSVVLPAPQAIQILPEVVVQPPEIILVPVPSRIQAYRPYDGYYERNYRDSGSLDSLRFRSYRDDYECPYEARRNREYQYRPYDGYTDPRYRESSYYRSSRSYYLRF